MKKIMNHPGDVVEEMLQGLVLLHPGLARLPGHKVLLRADAGEVRSRQVALLSGGGSGHEPAHAGYVGAGMLSAAVAGEVFTSPSSDSVLAAIQAVAGEPGALLVVKNYTGDRLNFGLAAERARAEGIAVETVLVDDDVALKSSAPVSGARGLAGTVFLHKLLGAAAAEGARLEPLARIGRAAVESLATMGVSLSAGTSPAVGKPSFELGDAEMELGLGIHGEPGVRRAPLPSAHELTQSLLSEILAYGRFGAEKRVALMINNLGATTWMELAIVARHAVPFLQAKGFTVERVYAGTFLSSLDMAGISLSVLGVDEDRLRWLDAPTAAPAWPNALPQRPGALPPLRSAGPPRAAKVARRSASAPVQRTRGALLAACDALLRAEAELTELDRIAGDGDLGSSMARAAGAVQRSLDDYPLDDLPATLQSLSRTLAAELGGSSGPLYGVLFLRGGMSLAASSADSKVSSADDLVSWAEAIRQGCLAIGELGGAKPGDRTMLDALDPFWRALRTAEPGSSAAAVVRAALDAAEHGADATAGMKPRMGRSSYLGERVLGSADPGARAVAIWLRAAGEAAIAPRAVQEQG